MMRRVWKSSTTLSQRSSQTSIQHSLMVRLMPMAEIRSWILFIYAWGPFHGQMVLIMIWWQDAWTRHSIHGWLYSNRSLKLIPRHSSMSKRMLWNAWLWSLEILSITLETALILSLSPPGSYWISICLYSQKS